MRIFTFAVIILAWSHFAFAAATPSVKTFGCISTSQGKVCAGTSHDTFRIVGGLGGNSVSTNCLETYGPGYHVVSYSATTGLYTCSADATTVYTFDPEAAYLGSLALPVSFIQNQRFFVQFGGAGVTGIVQSLLSQSVSTMAIGDLQKWVNMINGGSPVTGFSLVGSFPTVTGVGLSVGSVYALTTSGLVLAQGNSLSTMPGICVAVTSSSCQAGGLYTAASTIGNGNIGATVYVSPTTAGGMTTTAPSSGQYMNTLGTLTAPNTITLNPSLDVFGF